MDHEVSGALDAPATSRWHWSHGTSSPWRPALPHPILCAWSPRHQRDVGEQSAGQRPCPMGKRMRSVWASIGTEPLQARAALRGRGAYSCSALGRRYSCSGRSAHTHPGATFRARRCHGRGAPDGATEGADRALSSHAQRWRTGIGVKRCRRIPKLQQAGSGGPEQLHGLPRVIEDRCPLLPMKARARTRRALRCCVVAAANGAPATVSFTVPALPDRGRQQPGRCGSAQGVATHFASSKWTWEDLWWWTMLQVRSRV
jgi:hypothetical protein